MQGLFLGLGSQLKKETKISTEKISLEKKHEIKKDNFERLHELLKNEVNKKELELKEINDKRRSIKYPEYTNPELVRKVGEEITVDLREKIHELISEEEKFSALGYIPKEQREYMIDRVKNNRFFILSGEDHDKARIEFEVYKKLIIKEWEQKYGLEWPKNPEDVVIDGEVHGAMGKNVSRHHHERLSVFAVPNDIKDFDATKVQNRRHYSVNEYWNMVPSLHPKEHVMGIHNDKSKYTEILGPVKLEYQTTTEKPYQYIVPKENKMIKIPLTFKYYDYFLQQLEKKSAGLRAEQEVYERSKIPQKQKELAMKLCIRFIKEYPNNKEVKEIPHSQQKIYIAKLFKSMDNLIREWEKNTNKKWPENAGINFLVPPYYEISKINNKEFAKDYWYIITPDVTERPYRRVKPKKLPRGKKYKQIIH